jgi:ABC-type antimicrobial peptide transport system permease subunit
LEQTVFLTRPALLLSRTLRRFLYGVGSYDPATFIMVAVVLVFVSLAASVFPARRAAAADPIIVLKTD